MKHFSLVFALVIITCSSVSAQSKRGLRHQLSTSVYRYETIPESLHGVKTSSIFDGLFYEIVISDRFNSIIGVEYGKKIIKDYCNNCNDAFQGEGRLKYLSLLAGIKYKLKLIPGDFITPFIQADAYYSTSEYVGDFDGGLDGNGISFNNDYKKNGLISRFGLDISPIKCITITPMTSFKIITIKSKAKTAYKLQDLSWIPIELRLGINF